MALFQIVFGQVVLMMLMMLAGGISYWRKWIDDVGVKQISNLLLFVINPLTIISAYQIEFSMEKLMDLLIIFTIGITLQLFYIFVCKYIFKNLAAIEKYGMIFPNAGFIGIPLVKAILGDGAVFQLSAFLVATNFVMWTYGIYIVTNDKQYMTIKKAIVNPATIGTIIGLLVFFSPVKLPSMVFNAVNTLGNMNTPLAMIILGCYIVKSDLRTLFNNIHLYKLSLIRLVLLPACTMLILYLLPVSHLIRMVLMIACGGPCAVNTMVFAIQFGGDSVNGARLVSLSSLLSMLSLPVVLTIAGMIL